MDRGTLLDPNGSGKTTLVRILTTLLKPDSGSARVAGHDIHRVAATLRSAIGLASQYAAADKLLTGRENPELVGERPLSLNGSRSARLRTGWSRPTPEACAAALTSLAA